MSPTLRRFFAPDLCQGWVTHAATLLAAPLAPKLCAAASAAVLASVALTATATHAAEPPAEPQLRIEAGMHTVRVNRIATDAAGRYAVTASEDKTARVWDVASGRLLQVLRPPLGQGDEGKLFAMAISPDGAVVALGGATGWAWSSKSQVYLFDRASGRLLRNLTGLTNSIRTLAFSPDGQSLVATLGAGKGIWVWVDWRDGSAPLIDSSYGNDAYGAGWSREGRLATSSFDGQIRLYAPGNAARSGGALTPIGRQTAPGGNQPYTLAFTPDGSRIAVGYFDTTRVDVLDGASLEKLFSADTTGVTNGNLAAVAWSGDGQTLVAGGSWQAAQRGVWKMVLRRWAEGGRGPAQDTPSSISTIMDIAPMPGGGWLVGASDPAWGVLSSSGAWQPLAQLPIADLRNSTGQAFLLNANASAVQFGFEPYGKQPHVFDVRQRSLQAGLLTDATAPRTSGTGVQNWEMNLNPTWNGQPLKLGPFETSFSLAGVPDTAEFALGAHFQLRLFNAQGQPKWAISGPGITWGVNIPPQGRVLVAAYGDGTIRWYRLSDGKELLAFFPHADRKRWVLWTPSGYYDASPGAEELIGWHLNRGQTQAADFFPASRFRDRFYRPDIIDRVLDTLDEAQALAQADEARGRSSQRTQSIAQVLPPVVETLSSSDLRSSQTQVTVRVRGRAAADAPVTGWRVRVNGQAQPDARGLGRQDAAAGVAEREFSVTIPAQDSEIQVFAENRHGVSVPATIRVAWAGAAAKPDAFEVKPKLYVLAVGVAQYQHKDIPKLGLSAKDARDFAAAMQRQKGRLYREVEVRVVTEGEATRDNVIDGLDWLQKQVTQSDVGMLFIAGHGVDDPALGYTFLPWNADPDRLKRTGITMSDITTTLRSIVGKGIAFVDTCHSGNVLGSTRRAVPSDNGLFVRELASAENGVVVFSSSTGRQYSLEDPAWGNGAFTKALIEGMDGAADYQKSGRITHNMLGLYVSERVKTLTRGQQSPVKHAPTGVADFPLATVR